MDSFEPGFYQIGCDSCKIDLPKTRCATIPVSIGGQDVARAAMPATAHSLSAFGGM
jgi:hypothetical protein